MMKGDEDEESKKIKNGEFDKRSLICSVLMAIALHHGLFPH